MQQLWMPTTPAKITPASSRRSQPPGQSWLEPALLVTNAAQDTTPPWELPIQIGSSTSSDHPNYLPPCLPLLVRFGNHREIHVSQNMSRLEGKVFLDASLSNTSCCCCGNQKAEYGLPVTLFPICDSLPESTLNVSKMVKMSAPPTPATTEKFYKTLPDKQLSLELTDIDEAGARVENLMTKDIIVPSKEASERLIGVQKVIERKNNGIDLNLVSPKKRPQMKKHRPKVFEEGKPSRSPKPVTPQLETDEQMGRKEGTSCKRKYARRKKAVNHFPDTASNAESTGETKPVRRCLNFDLEEQLAVSEFSDAMSMFKKVLGARVLEECDESAVTSLSVKETADFDRDLSVKLSPETISDHSGSTYQPNYECSKLSQVPALPAKINKSMRSSIKKMPFLNSSVKHFKALARETACLDSASFSSQSSSEVTQRNLNFNKISETLPKGTKRVQLSFDEAAASNQKAIVHSYVLRGCSSNAGTKESSPTSIHKRIRIERWGPEEVNFNASKCWDIKQLSNGSENFTVAEAPRFMVQEKMKDLERILAFNQTEGYVRNNLVSGAGEASLSSSRSKSNPAKPSKQKNEGIIQQSTTKKLSKFKDTLENKIFGKQPNLEISEEILNSLNTRIKTRHTFVEEWPSECSNGISSAQKIVEGGALSARSLDGKNLNVETFSVDSQSTCYYNVSAPFSLSLGTLVPFKNTVDDIVRKLRRLSIKSDEVSSSQLQNSIVPYVDHGGIMTTYERNFHLIKRQRPRAKVDLDAESNRVWKLLMGKDCSEGVERSDVDKEKWWDEERRIFRGRVDSFIARMHLVQGDRRFTQWKGSVVDSVVGVFLTQNVSDHLSSSAFMTLAANFPLSRRKYGVPNGEMVNTSTEIQNRCIIPFIDNPKLQSNLLDHGSFHCSLELNVSENGDQKDNSNFSETHGSISTSSITYYSRQKGKGKSLNLQEKEATLYQESTVSVSGTTNQAEMEDVKLHEDAITSQNSACSSQNSPGFHVPSNKHIGSNSIINIEADDYFSVNTGNDTLGSSSFTKLIQIAESCSFNEFYGCGRGMISATKNQETNFNFENNPTLWSQLDNSKDNLLDMSPPTESCHFVDPFNSKIMVNNANLSADLRSHLLSTSSEIISSNAFEVMSINYSESDGSVAESTSLHKIVSSSNTATNIDSFAPIRKLTTQMEVGANMTSATYKNMAKAIIDVTKNENPNACSSLQTEDVTIFHQKDGNSMFQGQRTHNTVQALDQLETCRTQQTTISNNEIKHSLDVVDKAGPNPKSETCSFQVVSPEKSDPASKARKRRSEVEDNSFDWESLRKEVCCTKPAKERSSTTMDSVDWEAVRIADVSRISESIRERGMNNVLAERIKEFLNRLVREHGSIDLEWLRDFPPDKVKDYLLSIRGLGLKSVECVRLLTLQNLAFPVDTNVGRICVRLGWVPLQPLPESLQLHLLELYPVLETIQKYLWPRLCKLDQRTLYELHYQMITFGKVFCTKRKPNCNSCPMRGECKHFASAFASARLALPAPEDKSVMSFTTIIASDESQSISINPTPLPQLEGGSNSCTFRNNCGPIIEEPASPEPECPEALESAIEDAFYEDLDEIPTIKLNLEEFTQNLRKYMEENMELQDGSLSKALVALTPEAASIPMPKLKNVSRLRTEHQVYEIPDKHPLLEGVDPREPDDPSPYLLAIWTPGETAQSTEPPKACCNSQDPNQLCERSTCFACKSIQEAESHNIPCRTAMGGSFPLNGTYFQVNEVFADHHSSCDPIYVPRDWIWNLPRRTVYFGTSIPTIFRGLTTEGIQQCFWRGFVCVRGFDRVTRAPKPLYARLHFPASKAPKNKKAAEPKVEN
ncbi:protein ROS1-like isoform X2 [Phalaenopsis equestris]|uniref:protein ROS1-like isoform X2 n=1 Tax=Phalaenopsis equestris TaxID=78828 RepID=UPI0009E492D0|nr:protein ROS1-like isoform X2 [Phalaenopsis equestris]